MRTAIAAAATLAAASAAIAQGGPFNPYLELYDPHDWTLESWVNVRAWQETDANGMPVTEEFVFDSAAIVFPLVKGSASSVTHDRGIRSELRLNDVAVEARPEMMPDYHSGARLGKWALVDWWGKEVQLKTFIPTTCWKTRLNEDAAASVTWPQEWPAEPASTFDAQFYVDLGPDGPYDMKPVKDLVDRWTGGKDPKGIRPLQLAKFLAGQVQSHVQPSGNGIGYNRIGLIEGIDLQGAPRTAQRGRGSEFDMVCLLAAVYREAGLPARTVIGYDIGESKNDDRKKVLERKGSENLRAWVEFALVDQGANNRTYWIPVDVVRMRKTSSRVGDLDKPWKYFGSHDELDGIVPFAFHFHPPTTVRAYGTPGFWGWLVTPRPPERAVQTLRFTAFTTPQVGAPPPDQKQERRNR